MPPGHLLDPPMIAIEFISLNHEVKEVGIGKVVCSGKMKILSSSHQVFKPNGFKLT